MTEIYKSIIIPTAMFATNAVKCAMAENLNIRKFILGNINVEYHIHL